MKNTSNSCRSKSAFASDPGWSLKTFQHHFIQKWFNKLNLAVTTSINIHINIIINININIYNL